MKNLELFIEWDFIASLNKNEKPCFNDRTKININEWFVTWRRRYKGEKGEKGIIYVKNLIAITREYIEKIEDMDEINLLMNVLERSLIGLNNVIYTYEIDNQIPVAEEYTKFNEMIKQLLKNCQEKMAKKNHKKFFCNKIIIKE